MQKTMVGKIRRLGMAAALVALVAGTGAAHAVLIKATWDPLFDATFSVDVGWRGQADFDVAQDCLVANTSPVPGTNCGPANLVSLSLQLYKISDNTLVFNFNDPGPSLGAVSQLRVDGTGLVDGVTLDNPVVISTLLTLDPSILPTSGQLSLDFVLDFLDPGNPDPEPVPYSGPTLALFLPSEVEGSSYSSYTFGPYAPRVEWVPEPGTLSLVGVALAAFGLRRRRSR